MTTFTEALPATRTCPQGGTIRWTPNCSACGRCSGRLAISMNRTTTNYDLSEFHADGGRGFQFTKAFAINGAESYSVFIADEATRDAGFAHDSCECKGFLQHGHCKHLDAVRAILENAYLWRDCTEAPAPVAAPAVESAAIDPVVQVLRNLAGAPVPPVKNAAPGYRYNTASDLAADAAYRW